MTITTPQRRALEAIAGERITYLHEPDRYYTLGRDFPRARQDVVDRLVLSGLAEIVFRENSREGALVLTDSGREALGLSEPLAITSIPVASGSLSPGRVA